MPRPVTMCMPAAALAGRIVGEGLDQPGADAAAAEGGGQIDVQVGRKLPAQLGELGAEIGDVGEPLLHGRILDGAHQIAGNRVVALQGEEQGVAATPQIAAEPAFAEGVALRPGGKVRRAGLEEDRVDLRQPSSGCRSGVFQRWINTDRRIRTSVLSA